MNRCQSQLNIDEAARSIGVAANTMLRWMKQPEFQKEYREARRAAFGQSVARFQQSSSAAALLKMLIDPETPASVRVRAAECMICPQRGTLLLQSDSYPSQKPYGSGASAPTNSPLGQAEAATDIS